MWGSRFEIPDDLYRLLEAKCSFEGRSVREVTLDLYRRWLAEGQAPSAAPAETSGQWLDDWIALADKTVRNVPPGSTTREQLDQDRRRMEPP